MIDTHCHIFSEYYDDIEHIVNMAKECGVEALIINGYDTKSNNEVLDLVEKYSIVYGALGYYPSEADKISDDDLKFIEENVDNKKIVAVGEIGLDYYNVEVNHEHQKELFLKQIAIAERHHKPIIVHSREAIADTYEMLKNVSIPKVIHCYSGSLEMAKEFVKIGSYLGIGGILTYKNARKMVEVVKGIDLKYLLLETDSPYLTPEPYRFETNEPKNLIPIAKRLAELKSVDIAEVKRQTTATARRLFDI